jgi:hypothetical protein
MNGERWWRFLRIQGFKESRIQVEWYKIHQESIVWQKSHPLFLEVIARIDIFGVKTLESLNPRILDPFFPSSREKNH